MRAIQVIVFSAFAAAGMSQAAENKISCSFNGGPAVEGSCPAGRVPHCSPKLQKLECTVPKKVEAAKTEAPKK